MADNAATPRTFTQRQWWMSWWRGAMFGVGVTLAVLGLTGHIA